MYVFVFPVIETFYRLLIFWFNTSILTTVQLSDIFPLYISCTVNMSNELSFGFGEDMVIWQFVILKMDDLTSQLTLLLKLELANSKCKKWTKSMCTCQSQSLKARTTSICGYEYKKFRARWIMKFRCDMNLKTCIRGSVE